MKKQSLFLISILFLVGGCNLFTPIAVLFHSKEKKVKAEYKGLEEKKTVIIVEASPGTEFEFPNARANVALATAYELGSKIKKVTVVDWEKIDAFQRDDLDWLSLPVSEIGKKFDAQRVLYVDLIEYTTMEEFSVNLLRGRMIVDLRVYEMDGPRPDEPVYQTEVSVIYPENTPIPLSDESTKARVELQTIRNLAIDIVRKFYDHKIPKKINE